MLKRKLFATIVLAILVFALTACTGATSHSLSGSGSYSFNPASWTIQGSYNGYISRDFTLTSNNATSIRVENSNSEGSMVLTLSQGDIKQTVDISEAYSGNINLSDFAMGDVNVRLDLDNARDINLSISWQ